MVVTATNVVVITTIIATTTVAAAAIHATDQKPATTLIVFKNLIAFVKNAIVTNQNITLKSAALTFHNVFVRPTATT